MEQVVQPDLRCEILQMLQDVKDPEIPVLSVVEMGMIGAVTAEESRGVLVNLIPTFTACPAISVIKNAIIQRLKEAGFEAVTVQVDHSVTWSTDRLSDRALNKLREFGLATPFRHGGDIALSELELAACPHCGSLNTTMQSLFGSTLCRSMHFCFDCRQAFERFKPV